MKTQSTSSMITEWILKFAIILFVFKIFYHTPGESFFDSKFISGLVGVLKLVTFFTISMGVLVFKKDTFKVIGFIIIFLGSFYFTLQILSDGFISFKYMEYILLMAIAIYNLVRISKSKKRDRNRSLKS
ncbi:MAG: hypothetical protein K9J13_07235 [Saprospiraceae bacterium]|nr:hypothetical protein [Saprospiraceae bacterium]